MISGKRNTGYLWERCGLNTVVIFRLSEVLTLSERRSDTFWGFGQRCLFRGETTVTVVQCWQVTKPLSIPSPNPEINYSHFASKSYTTVHLSSLFFWLISVILPLKYEPSVLETCLNLLQVSPQHQKNRRMDYLNRNNPVYISRVVSAMVSASSQTSFSNLQDRTCFIPLVNWLI